MSTHLSTRIITAEASGSPPGSGFVPADGVRVEGRVYSARDLARMHPGGELWVRAFAGTHVLFDSNLKAVV